MNRSEGGSIEGYVDPTPPFDFALSAHIFADGDLQVAHFDGTAHRQVLRIDDSLVLATVESVGSVDDPRLRARFTGNSALSDHDLTTATALISTMFNAKLDVTPFYRSIHEDPVMAVLASKLRGLKNPRTMTVFEALVDSVIEQQISLRVAHILQYRVIKALGDTLFANGRRY